MSKNRYKRYSRGGRFKDQGQGLRASVDAIRQQRQIEIDALKIQAGQQRDIDKQQISSLDRKARVEEDNRNVLKDLENKIYKTKYDALQVRANREVDSILGEAKNKEREAKFWDTFATDYSKTIGKVATELGEFGQYLQAVNNDKWNRRNNPNKHEEFATNMERMYEINNDEMINAAFKAKGADLAILGLMVKKQDRSNKRNSEKSVSELITNINTVTNAIKRTNGGRLNAGNINLIYENAGYLLLYQRNIPFNSQEATRLLDTLNFKANAQAEAWQNKTKFDDDLKSQQDFALGYVALHKKLSQTTDVKEIKKLEEALQVRHKQFHLLVGNSFQDLGNGRYGLVPLNPAQINNSILDFTFDAFNFTDVTEAVETYDRLKIFDPKSGFTIKVKGKGVGTVEKSATLQEAIANRVATNEARQDGLQNEIEQDKREKVINPVIKAWEDAVASEDWTLINSEEFQDKIERIAMDPKFNKGGGTPELTKLYEIIGYGGKQVHGTLSDYLEIKGLIFSGRHREAMNELLRSTKSSGTIPPGFAPLFKEAKLITELDGQGKSIRTGAQSLLDGALSTSRNLLGKPEGVDEAKYNKMQTLVEHRLLQVMLEDTSNDDPMIKYSRAYSQVQGELKEGLEGKGVFAMKQASLYVPPVIDGNGKVVPGTDGEGYRARKDLSKDEKAGSTPLGTYFLAVDDITVPGADINETNIEELFFKEGVSLQDALLINLNDPAKSILSRDQKRELIRMSTLSQYGEIPDPLKVLIARAKIKDPKATSYEVMNQVLSAITATDEFKSFQGSSWTPNHEDVTKKLLGTCTKSAKNNFALCMTKSFAADNPSLVELNKQIASGNIEPFNMSDKQIYDVLTNPRKTEQ